MLCLLAQAAIARNIFVTPNDPVSTQLATVNGDPFSFGTTLSTIPGSVAVLPSPNAQKFYVIGSGTSDNLGVLNGRFPNLTEGVRINVGMAITAADISPDGRRLIVAGPNGAALIDTSTDRVLLSAGSVDTGASPIDIAISVDSRYAYVLSSSNGRLTSIDLNSNAVAATVQVPNTSVGVSVAPTGVVYVSAASQIYEINPATLAVRAVINTNGTPEALQFTPNGRYGIGRNTLSFSGRALVILDLQSRRSLETPTSAAFSSLAVVSNEIGYGVIPGGMLVEFRIASDGTVTQATPSVNNGLLPSAITDIAASGELPSSRYLIISSGGNAMRLNTATGELIGPITVGQQGGLSSVVPLSTGSVQGVLSYNPSQTIPAGSTSLPLTLIAYDGNGSPTAGAPVTFSTSATGIAFSNPSATTNMMGIAATTVTIPAGRTGSFQVNGVMGQRTFTFNINIGDPGLPGGGTGPGTSTPSFTILSGQGSVLKMNFGTSSQEPMRVKYMAADGSAIANSAITWTLLEGGGVVVIDNSGLTDGDGVSTANITTGFLAGANTPLRRYAIRASAPDGQSQTFYVTAVRTNTDGSGGVFITPRLVNGSTITARTGEVLANAISFNLRSALDGTQIPFGGLRIVSGNTEPNFGPVVECRGGNALSDANGDVTCDLVITGRTGITNFQANIGAGSSLYNYTVNVIVGLPATVRAISGTGQTGLPGQQLGAFTVEVKDGAGNLLADVPVSWNIPPAAGVVSIQNRTDFNGRASATITLPSTPGTYVVSATANGITATFSATGNAVAGNLVQVGGDNQSVIVGQQFGQQLQVRVVDPTGAALAGQTVTFSVQSGNASVSSPSVVTNAQGIAATTVTAGNSAGAIVVSASTGNFRLNFNLTSRLAGPVFTTDSIVNGASFQPGISPGSIAYIRVAGIAPNVRGSVVPTNLVGPLPTSLANVQVIFSGIAAPIFAVSNINGEESVAVQVPFEVPVGSATVTIQGPGGSSTTVSGVQIETLKPGLFTWLDPATNSTYAVAVRPDGSFVGGSNPARRGEVIRVYATGLGQTSPATATNRVGGTGQSVAAPLVVGVNNAGTRLISAELMTGTVGVYVVSLQIPTDAASGPNQPIGLAAVRPDGGAEFANSAFVPIQ
ncbi:MAG: Ig-like domain-containing protein [Bryobacteraceae bacterium]|nr:Ig-like domain-containing protein [Bryobacteraceae bacterium]